MDIRSALKEQYQAGLAMLADCIQKCPDDLWLSGQPQRETWRIAAHAAYFTHLYGEQGVDQFEPWPGRPQDDSRILAEWEPYEIPESFQPLTREQVHSYVGWIAARLDSVVDGLDLEREDTGFPWYPNMSKLSHQLLNIRHLAVHLGQLQELLFARGFDLNWVGKGTAEHWRQWEVENP